MIKVVHCVVVSLCISSMYFGCFGNAGDYRFSILRYNNTTALHIANSKRERRLVYSSTTANNASCTGEGLITLNTHSVAMQGLSGMCIENTTPTSPPQSTFNLFPKTNLFPQISLLSSRPSKDQESGKAASGFNTTLLRIAVVELGVSHI